MANLQIMSDRIIWLSLGLYFCVIGLVLSDILCKDSKIDSITYLNDIQMYFFTSGGYYWYIKESQFPPTDDQAKRLPSPFTIGQAAVYVDGDNGCANVATSRVKAKEKEIWISEQIGNINKLTAFDTKTGKWSGDTIPYNKDRCISVAKIDWSAGQQIDAMFARNYLQLFFIQGEKYAMVDCSFICTNPDGYGTDKPPQKTSDFHTVDYIYGMFVKKNKDLFVFMEREFYSVSIQSVDSNGKMTTIKNNDKKDILIDFIKIKEPGECTIDTTPPSGATTALTQPQNMTTTVLPFPSGEDTTGAALTTRSETAVNTETTTKGEESQKSGGTGTGIIIGIIVIVIILVVIGLIVFFVLKKKSSEAEALKDGPEAEAGAQVASPGAEGSRSKMEAKAGSSKAGSTAPSTMNSQMSVRSKMAPKTSAVNSSVSKK